MTMETRTSRRLEGAGRKPTAACLVLILAAIVLSRASLVRDEWHSDTGGWMLISRLMNEGYKPYVDLWDNKLPPIYWLGEGLLKSGRPKLAMFALDVGLTLLGAVGIAVILGRCGLKGPTALACAGVSVCGSMPFWFAHSNNVYAAAPFSVGIAVYCVAVRRRSAAGVAVTSWLGGCLVGLGAITSALLVFPAIAGTILAWGAGRGWRRRLVAATAYAIGGLTTVAALLVLANSGGYLRPMLNEAVFGAASYASARGTGGYDSPGQVAWAFRENVAEGSIGWLLALIGTLCVAVARPRPGRLPRTVAVFAVAWFAIQVVMTFISGYQFKHYHYLVGWGSGLLAGAGVAALGGRRMGRPWLVAGALAVLILLSLVINVRMASSFLKLARPGPPSHIAKLKTMIKANIPAEDSLLLADGYVDAIGALVELPNPPGSRHVLASMYEFVPIRKARRGFFAGLGQTLLADFEDAPPDWLIRAVGHDDLLSPKVERLYDEVTRNGEYILYRRKSEEPAPSRTDRPLDASQPAEVAPDGTVPDEGRPAIAHER